MNNVILSHWWSYKRGQNLISFQSSFKIHFQILRIFIAFIIFYLFLILFPRLSLKQVKELFFSSWKKKEENSINTFTELIKMSSDSHEVCSTTDVGTYSRLRPLIFNSVVSFAYSRAVYIRFFFTDRTVWKARVIPYYLLLKEWTLFSFLC